MTTDISKFQDPATRKATLKDYPASWLVSRVAYLEKQMAYVASLQATPSMEKKTLAYSQETLTAALCREPPVNR